MKIYAILLTMSVMPVSICTKNDISASQAAGFFTMAYGAARKSPIIGLTTLAAGYLIVLKSDVLDNHFADPQSPVNKALEHTGSAIVDFIQKSKNQAIIEEKSVEEEKLEETEDNQTNTFNTTE